jgi:hypothetical protein
MRKRLAGVVLLALLALVSLAGSVAAVSDAAAGSPTIDIQLDHFFMDMLMGGGCGGG